MTDVEPAGAPAARLPRHGQADAADTRLTTVGYGTSEKEVVKGEGPTFPFAGDRWYGIGSFNALTKEQLKMSQNQAHGDGGACYGDSGGPTFLGAGRTRATSSWR